MNKPADANHNNSPFHRGEQAVQARLGVRDVEIWARKVVRDYLPEQHREFYAAQPFLVVSARDKAGQPWVSLVYGSEGFVSSPDPRHLVVKAQRVSGDALEHSFQIGADIGVLGIEPVTRRRNRVNGRIVAMDSESFTLRVGQSFGNCPQYIRERASHHVEEQPSVRVRRSSQLSDSQKEWIATADTFFIASGYQGKGQSASYGMDASHRGGERGFVEVISETALSFPDYAGNNHFNTLGNLMLDPRVGLLFIDFENGSLLQLSGTATVDWHPDESSAKAGALRLVNINIEQVVELSNAVPLRWERDASSVRSLRVVEKQVESQDVTSFILEARDGGALPTFEPGQHLPIEMPIAGIDKAISRTYSLSGSPSDSQYRITVKRIPKGLASRYLHDHIEPGAIIESRTPAGDFTLTCSECPLVLVSAGVGVTPMVSILHAVAEQHSDRPVWFIHGARDGDHHPLAGEVRQIVSEHSNIKLHVTYSRPRSEDILNKDYHSTGRVDGKLLSTLVSDKAAHYFLCGPQSFMADIQSDLERRSIPEEQIHYETFGPAA